MIYLVSNNLSLFEEDCYERISLAAAVNLVNSWECIQFDVETGGRNPHLVPLLCAQFGNKKENIQIVVDCQDNNNILAFKDPLENKEVIGHNIKFDLQFLYNYSIVPLKVYDTMIAEQVLYLGYPVYGKPGGISYALKALGERYLGIDIDKSTRGEIIWRGLDSKVILYAAGDVKYLEDIKELQEKEAIKKDCIKAIQLENRFVPVTAYLEWCGIKLDQEKWKTKMQNDLINLETSKKALDSFIENLVSKDSTANNMWAEEEFCIQETVSSGQTISHLIPKGAIIVPNSGHSFYNDHDCTRFDYVRIKRKFPFCEINLQGDLFTGFDSSPHCIINWSSSRQVIQVAKFLGFNTVIQDKKTGEDKESVLEKELSNQRGINDEFLDLYFKYQEYSKLVSSFGQGHLNAVNPKTGRIHTTYKQLGAASGRMSCGSSQSDSDLAKFKKLKDSDCKYPNIQQLPHDEQTRSCFVAENGNLWVSCDYSAKQKTILYIILFIMYQGASIYNVNMINGTSLRKLLEKNALNSRKAILPLTLSQAFLNDLERKVQRL